MKAPRTTTRSAVLLVSAALAIALIGTSCGAHPKSPPTAQGSGGTLLPATPAQLPTFDMAKFRMLLAQLRGTPVVVNIWASWCGPCQVEAPNLASVARAYQGKAQFLGVDILDDRTHARAFIQTYGWPYPSVFDSGASIRHGLGLLAQPDTVVFDRNGKQVGVISGPASDAALRQLLSKVVSP